MKTILIRPPRDKTALNLSHFTQSEPLGLEILYNIFEKFTNVEIFDMVFDKRELKQIIDESVLVVGISSICNDIKSTIELSKMIKSINKNITIFVGGYQATSTPHFFYTPYIDHIIKWTKKENMEKFIQNVIDKKEEIIEGILSRNFDYEYKQIDEKNQILISNRESTKKYRKHYSYFAYQNMALLDSQMYFAEINSIREKKIAFVDYDFLLCKNLNEILLDLEKRKKRIMIYSSVESLIKNKHIISLIGRCGIESILLFVDDYSNKSFFLLKDILRGSGINIWIYLTLYPHYAKEDFINIGRFAYGVEAKVLTLTPYFPLLGTKDYDKYKPSFLYEDLHEHYGKVVIKPEKLNLTTYYFYIIKCLINFYSKKIFYFLKTFGLKATLNFYLKSIIFAFKVFKIILSNKKVFSSLKKTNL